MSFNQDWSNQPFKSRLELEQPLEPSHLEQHRLIVFRGVSEVAKTNSDQTESLVTSKIYSLAQRERNLGEFLSRRRRHFGGKAARQDGELLCLQLEHNRSRGSRLFAGSRPCLFG